MGKSIAAYLRSEELDRYLVRYGMPAMTQATITTRFRLEDEMERVRDEGVAVDNEENMQGIICVGGPIFASEGKPVAALSVSGPAVRMSQNLPAIKIAVREAVRKISLLLGHSVTPAPRSAEIDTVLA